MRKAFTLLELVFVIIILGILAALALPRLSSSKDEAELSKALSNIKTLISDVSTYALRNDSLSSMRLMSHVDEIENLDLSSFNAMQSLKFKVGNDEECLKVLFINESNIIALGIASNDNIASLVQNLAKAQNEVIKNPSNATKTALNTASQALMNADFTSTSTNKACSSLSTNSNFKALTSKIYILLGG